MRFNKVPVYIVEGKGTHMTRDELVEVACKGYWPLHWPKAFAEQDVVSIKAHMGNAIAAIEAAGLAIVPVKATDAMLSAAWEAMFTYPYDGQSAPMIGAGLDAMIWAGKI